MKRGAADSLAGFLVSGRREADYTTARGDRSTWYRRWSQLRALGISVDDQAQQLVTVPVSRYFGQLADAWAVAA